MYLVGGAVRDFTWASLSRKDYVVVATPEHMLAKGFQPVAKIFLCFFIPKRKKNMHLHVLKENLVKATTAFNFYRYHSKFRRRFNSP